MAPSPIELSLHSLLPTISILPPDLVSLAQSLLSQSKIKAAHLKSDEEVGRIYACCHIAAERLRSKHGFEVGKARPPVPPRVYGKLKGFLEGVLKAEGPRTPRGGRGDGGSGSGVVGSGGGKKTPESRPTSMRKRWAEARRPMPKAVDSRDEGTRAGGLDVPEYAMPMIRHLCKACNVGKAAPHIFTGVSVVLKEYGRPKQSTADTSTPGSGRKRKRGTEENDEKAVSENDVPGVVLVLFIAVVRRMYGAEQLMGGEHLEAAKEFAAADEESLPTAAREDTYFDDALARFDLSDTDGCGKWLEMEWFDNVPSATAPNTQDIDDESEDNDNETPVQTTSRKKPAKTPLRRKEKHGKFVDDSDLGRAGLLSGLATMFQPAVDWLSEERVLEFQRWKREVGREIAVIEERG